MYSISKINVGKKECAFAPLATYVPLSYVLPCCRLFINCDRLTSEAQEQLASGGVQQFAYEEVANHITALLQASEGAIWVSAKLLTYVYCHKLIH